MFLAGVIEQLDLSLEHLLKGDAHNSRFSLMLTDNAVELMLHQIAKDQKSSLRFSYRQEKYPHEVALAKALGKAFEDKVRFAKLERRLSTETARTINIMHGFRNEIYHVGLQHETILAEIASLYFDTACRFITSYDPRGLGWTHGQALPERAQKYFHGSEHFPGGQGDFSKGCMELVKRCGHDPVRMINVLADQMDTVLEQQDICIQIVADGVYEGQRTTRDKAVLNTQAWKLAFSSEGLDFGAKHGFRGNRLQFVDWLGENYPSLTRKDPVPSWQKLAKKLRTHKDVHVALDQYQAFMTSTAELREALKDSAAAAEAEIDSLIDRARGN